MSIKKTHAYYQNQADEGICNCAYCRNYVQEIKTTHPELTDYLQTIGVDIEKPFELMPLEADEEGYIDYIGEQYVVMGSKEEFQTANIGGLSIRIAESHPDTNIEEEHYVIEVSPVRLKWVM